MKAVATMARTREAYEAAFQSARLLEYPEVDAFEQRMGYAIDRHRLENAARVLACPLKTNPPHWQHGRVVYAATRKYLATADIVEACGAVTLLDIGTAKGFSALCLKWSLLDASHEGDVESVDVIHPGAQQIRNSVLEVESGPQSLMFYLRSWPEADTIWFRQMTGIDRLQEDTKRIHVAFVDGKHDGHVVRQEGKLLAARQQCGDLAIFDDCQIPAVCQAVVTLQEFYKVDYITAGPREYAVGWRR